ncbi:MAG: tRNA pseudouridine(38-40) synthase TruA [bacterium]
MARFKLYIEYEGTRYSGWQVQKNSRTVQGEIQNAFHTVVGPQPIELYGSGRTDAGVHALLQIAHAEVKTSFAPEILRRKINDELPADITILEIEKAHPQFHARHDAVARSYLYQISRRRTAFGKRYVWWIKDPLDIRSMKKAAALFPGLHNFQSFTDDDPEEKSTKVELKEVRIQENNDLILIRIVGSHFIWKLVRRIVGVLAEVGRGSLSVDEVSNLLRIRSDLPAKLTAPPSGLFLERVYYPGEAQLQTLEPAISPGISFAAICRKLK